MPWIYNPNRSAESLAYADGQVGALPSRRRVYIAPEMMTGEIAAKLGAGILVRVGADPVTPQPEMKSVTSSALHDPPAIVAPVSSEEQVKPVAMIDPGPETTDTQDNASETASDTTSSGANEEGNQPDLMSKKRLRRGKY